jgi:hypothetical protein
MIIWSGLGFLVFVFAFGCSLAMNVFTNALLGNEYYQTHAWPLALAIAVAGALTWLVGNALNRRQGKVMIEKDTGRELLLRPNHSLFFIRMHYWGPILIALAFASLFFRA